MDCWNIAGVAGGTASGKTTVCNMIISQLRDQRVVLINQVYIYIYIYSESLVLLVISEERKIGLDRNVAIQLLSKSMFWLENHLLNFRKSVKIEFQSLIYILIRYCRQNFLFNEHVILYLFIFFFFWQDSFYRSLNDEQIRNVQDYNFDHPGKDLIEE